MYKFIDCFMQRSKKPGWKPQVDTLSMDQSSWGWEKLGKCQPRGGFVLKLIVHQ